MFIHYLIHVPLKQSWLYYWGWWRLVIVLGWWLGHSERLNRCHALSVSDIVCRPSGRGRRLSLALKYVCENNRDQNCMAQRWSDSSPKIYFFCLCHFLKVKYTINNILKNLSHWLKESELINQHIFFSLSKLIIFFNGKVIQVHHFIYGLFDLYLWDIQKWQLKCFKTNPYMAQSMPCQSLSFFITGARWWNSGQFLC